MFIMIKASKLSSLVVTSKKHECFLQLWINIYVLLDWFDTIFLWCFGKNSRSANNASFAIIKLPEILRLFQSLYNKVLFMQHNLKFRLGFGPVGWLLSVVCLSQVIDHVTCHKFECSHWWKIYFFKKNTL